MFFARVPDPRESRLRVCWVPAVTRCYGLDVPTPTWSRLPFAAWTLRRCVIGVVVAVILAARSSLHRFVRDTLSAEEAKDGLLLDMTEKTLLLVDG